MSLTLALDFLRELRLVLACLLQFFWQKPSSRAPAGDSGLVPRLLLSWAITGCAAALVDPVPQQDSLRLGQYRAVHGA